MPIGLRDGFGLRIVPKANRRRGLGFWNWPWTRLFARWLIPMAALGTTLCLAVAQQGRRRAAPSIGISTAAGHLQAADAHQASSNPDPYLRLNPPLFPAPIPYAVDPHTVERAWSLAS